jgi:anti-sigma factor ChrR (cupin superfamily)
VAEENGELASELAALYVLGCLTDDERSRVEERLRSGDIALREEFERYQAVAGQLALAAKPVTPPPAVKERLMEQVRRASAEPAPGILLQQGGLLLSSADRMPWTRSKLPGVWTKTLFVDKKRGYRTSLVRLEPGSEFPSHRHSDVEELFVIEGEMEIHGHLVGPGSYCRAEPDSLHQAARTKTGSVFLAVCSIHDKYVPA